MQKHSAPFLAEKLDRRIAKVRRGVELRDPTAASRVSFAREGFVLLNTHHGMAPIGDIPVPSVVHLRSQHFSAVVGEQDGHYILRDPGLAGRSHVGRGASG